MTSKLYDGQNHIFYNENGNKSFYTPDFYIENAKLYIEVKGYETEKDRCKWRDFNHKLLILKGSEIKQIKRGVKITTFWKVK